MKRRKSVPVKLQQRKTVSVEYIKVRYGGVVTWDAVDSDITVFVPDAKTIFGTKDRLFDVAKGQSISFKVIKRLKRGEIQKYYYTIYHKKFKDFATSNSSPAIIIMG